MRSIWARDPLPALKPLATGPGDALTMRELFRNLCP